jgi:hypothetical protein
VAVAEGLVLGEALALAVGDEDDGAMDAAALAGTVTAG